MDWTNEPPSEDGVYWYRGTPEEVSSGEPEIVSIAHGYVYSIGSDDAYPAARLKGLWSHRIDPPKG